MIGSPKRHQTSGGSGSPCAAGIDSSTQQNPSQHATSSSRKKRPCQQEKKNPHKPLPYTRCQRCKNGTNFHTTHTLPLKKSHRSTLPTRLPSPRNQPSTRRLGKHTHPCRSVNTTNTSSIAKRAAQNRTIAIPCRVSRRDGGSGPIVRGTHGVHQRPRWALVGSSAVVVVVFYNPRRKRNGFVGGTHVWAGDSAGEWI